MNPKSFPKHVLLCVVSAMLGSVFTLFLLKGEVCVSGNSEKKLPVVAGGRASGFTVPTDQGDEADKLPVKAGQKFNLSPDLPRPEQMEIVEIRGHWARVKYSESKHNSGSSIWINFEQVPHVSTFD